MGAAVSVGEDGWRRVSAQVEVPGGQDVVWRAVATGPGVSSWFVPARIEERVGGEALLSFGPDMDSVSRIVEWAPPGRFTADSQDLGPGAPTVRSEWSVEPAAAQGRCIVRVEHAVKTDSELWDGALASWAAGWPDFFRLLTLYLEHFADRPSALMALSASAPVPATQAWERLAEALGAGGLEEGTDAVLDLPEGLSLGGAAGRLAVHVQRVGRPPHPHELLLRITGGDGGDGDGGDRGDAPDGLAHLFAMSMGPDTHFSLRFYLYGESAEATKAATEPAWRSWLAGEFAG